MASLIHAPDPLSFHRVRRITASVSDKPSSMSPPSRPLATKLPIRKVPGDYGLPLIGPLKDRHDYFYGQGGRDEFFKNKIKKYKSTVFRTNMPPGPFISPNSNVVALLDAKSFPVLFDSDKVDKKDLFTGTYTPSLRLTGGYRVLSYLDPSEPRHADLKRVLFFLLQSRRDHVIPEFHNCYTQLFESLESDIAAKGKASFSDANEQAAFNFLARALYGSDPRDTPLASDAPKLIGKWVLFNLSPLLVLGLPHQVEDLLIHTFRLPAVLVKKEYERLYDFFYASSGAVMEEAARLGIPKDEACHNLLFATCFNSYGGMKIFFPNLIKWIGRGGASLHARLAREIRAAAAAGRPITMRAMEQDMPLMKSVVYEALRIEPPVALQYGRARRDMVVESHDEAYEIRAGEVLFGYQPFATRDPRVFDGPLDFVADRFVGEAGEGLLRHVVWSNGPETEDPTAHNKQCAGKDFVVLVARLMVVELFLRYDSFEIDVAASPLGSSVTVTSLKRASF